MHSIQQGCVSCRGDFIDQHSSNFQIGQTLSKVGSYDFSDRTI